MDTETSGFGAWGWIILIFLFFLGFSGGNGLFGNGGNGNTTASTIYAQQAATTANENSKAVIAQGYEAQLATMDSSYKTFLGFKDSQYQMAQCCCEIKQEIQSDGQMTRDLINANTIASLRNELNIALDTLATQNQTNTLIGALRPYPVPAYPVSSPYGSTGYYAYN
jgi:hypothetical protein